MEERWGTYGEAIELIRKNLDCSEVEAKAIFEEFNRQHPDKVKRVPLQ